MTRTSYSSRIITLLCFIFFLHDAFAVNSDVLTLLSLLTHWTFVPPLINSSWKVSDSNPCSWIGVQCDHTNNTNNLISLNLSSYGIFGQLGPEIGNLYHLQTLLLSSNGFSGKVPLELSNCSLLENLDLSENRFSGKIPYSLKKLQNLQFLRLSTNLLSGEIPDSLFEIRSLEEVSLHSNMLSGPIPTNIGNLTQLLRLYLYGNMFSGTIPSSIGNCSKLEDLELSFNRLRGEIPVSIWRIPSLVHVLVHNNSLSGELPFEMTNLKYLKNISLFDNQFSGVIPQSLGFNSSIVKLDCMNNKFTGTIPPNLCFGKHLLVLNMGINQLQGSIPSDVGRCATLTRLFLNENNFTGSLPKFESNLNLKYMDMSKNNISGPIPSSLGNSTNLTYINLSMNKFTGLIPSEVGNLVNLVILDLAHNNLQGSLPLRLSNCTKMDCFDVGFNFLNGSLPSSLRSWTNITTLVLRENHFTGGIPRFLAELRNLRELQLGGNLFGGEIPRSMGKLPNLFYGLNLSANRLTGDIPSEIRKLRLLQSLDISLNNLTGSIDALESLVSLIELNISYNLFNGSVPQGLMKLFISSPSSFTGNPLLCVSCLRCIKTSYINPCVYKSTDHKGISKVQIVMIELGSSILISVVLVIIIQRHFSRKESYTDSYPKQPYYYIYRGAGRIGNRYACEFSISGEEGPPALQKLVLQATENLSDQYIIGRGAHGIVYKAILGQRVFAVKKFEFKRNKEKQLRMMCKEVEVLGMYKHRNIIKYADYWTGADYGLVLYEFMENGSLYDILHEKSPPPPLTWNVRFNIAVGIAEGLAYLHNNCDPPIVHRDIKSKNILIDDNMEPIISDFGTALDRNLYENSYSYSETRKMLSTIVVGTPGYIAPENAYVIVQSRKSDVYSYGIVLLEIITRKKVVIPCLNDESNVTSLVSWARSVWLETGKIEYIADSYLAEAFPNSAALTKQVTTMFLLALQCTEKDLRKRPTMKDVIRLYKRDTFKWCDEEECVDTVAVAADTSLQPYSPNISPIIPVVSIDHHIHGESSRAAAQRHREVTFTADAEPMDYSDFSFRQDIDQFQSGFCVEDDWSRTPITYIDGLLVKLMENGNTKTQSKPKETSNSADQEHDLKTSATNDDISVSIDVKSLGYNDLKKATRNFRKENLIAEGGFGFVYKGWIDENTGAPTKPGKGIVVAIKRLKPESFQGHKEWLAEVNYLGQLHHENLVKLIGYCSEGKNRLLVYEFMQKGNLENHLFRKGGQPISWMTRINIAIGVAKGLTFLHSLDANVIYRDLKASNILLDSDFNPNLSDFGLARDGPTGDNTHVSTRVIGTHGYAAPEYVATGHLTPRSDVYSFGVVLLELLTGRRVVEYDRPGHTKETLVDWAMPFLSDSRRILRIMDTKLGGQYSKKGAQAAAALVLKCLHTDPKHRPTMVNALSALEALHSSNALPRTPKSGADNHHHATKHSSHHRHSHKSITNNNTRKH